VPYLWVGRGAALEKWGAHKKRGGRNYPHARAVVWAGGERGGGGGGGGGWVKAGGCGNEPSECVWASSWASKTGDDCPGLHLCLRITRRYQASLSFHANWHRRGGCHASLHAGPSRLVCCDPGIEGSGELLKKRPLDIEPDVLGVSNAFFAVYLKKGEENSQKKHGGGGKEEDNHSHLTNATA